MSLKEREIQTGLLQQGLVRSHSFGGLMTTPGSRRSLSRTLRPGWVDMGVLGKRTPSAHQDFLKANSLPPHIKVPKVPRPQRESIVAKSVLSGLRDCITATRKDLLGLARAQQDCKLTKSQGRMYEMEKQMKAAERYLKRLEFLLSQIEDIHDQYSLNHRLRDGARTMAHAYSLSPGKQKAKAVNNVYCGYRECTETLRMLEVHFEQLIGTFTLEMKGIQGFARLCSGDVFEVSIKHGLQKWKTRGKVAKDRSQTWDRSVHIFKCLMGEMLIIKAMEVRLLGKTVIMGSKICDTKDLFVSHPQLMTINLNVSGSLKLNVIVTWNPLDNDSKENASLTPSLSRRSPRSSHQSVITSFSSPPLLSALQPPKDASGSSDCDKDSSFGSMSARSSVTDSASPMSEYRWMTSSQAMSTKTDSAGDLSYLPGSEELKRSNSNESVGVNEEDPEASVNYMSLKKVASYTKECKMAPYPRNSSPVCNLHEVSLTSAKKSTGSFRSSVGPPTSLPEAVIKLRRCLEDIQSQFPELHSVEESVMDLHMLFMQNRSRHNSNTSEISLSVESALECFDFLNAECDDDFADDNPEVCNEKNKKESLLKAQDSPTASVPRLVTSSVQLDAFFLKHLLHCLSLVKDLGTLGPLRRREKESLRKLEKEGKLLALVLSHRRNFDNLKPHHIMPVPRVQVLWESVAMEDDEWCVTGMDVVKGLLPLVLNLVEPQSEDVARNVLEELVKEITDSEAYSPSQTVTAGHFLSHLMKPLQEIIPELCANIICSSLLSSEDIDSLQKGLFLLKKVTLHQTQLIAELLSRREEFSLVFMSFLHSNRSEVLLSSLFDQCLLLLESSNSNKRSSASTLLGYLIPVMSVTDERIPGETKANSSENIIDNVYSIECSDRDNLNTKSSNSQTLELSSVIDGANSSDRLCNLSIKDSCSVCEKVGLYDNNIKSCTCGTSSEITPAVAALRFLVKNDPSETVQKSASAALLNLKVSGQTQPPSDGSQGVRMKECK